MPDSQPSRFIPVAGPWITEHELAYVADAAAHGWYDQAHDYIQRFEKAFAHHTGRRYAISLPSCTSGLHLALIALGVGPGDEVIVPDATWIASAAPITYVGATPIFADIDPATWGLSAATVERCLSPKTKAIIVVNLYGHMVDWDPLLDVTHRHHIPVIEDAAESIGSRYKDRPSGSFGTMSCFSFHGSKTITTGEGGMIVMDDDDLFQRCSIMRDHGRLPGDILFQNHYIGYKYKMSCMQAAMGLAQLERLPSLVSKKRSIFAMYRDALGEIPGISLNPHHDDVFNSYWMTTAIFDKKIDKHGMVMDLKNRGIGSRPFFSPLSSLKAYSTAFDRERAQKTNVHAYGIGAQGINLPSALSLCHDDILYVADAIKSII